MLEKLIFCLKYNKKSDNNNNNNKIIGVTFKNLFIHIITFAQLCNETQATEC